MNRRRHAGILLTVTTIVATAACTDRTPENTPVSSRPAREKPVQTRTVADATTQADNSVNQVAAALGNRLDGWKTTTVPCSGTTGTDRPDRAWQLQGAANIAVDAGDQLSALQRLTHDWQQRGWQITDQQTFADDTRGTVSALDPATGTSVTVTTTKDLGRVAVVLASTCYLPAPGEDPANR
ncbi:hypothetical protein [Actinoplanes subglobosus]|uniref:PASTA domain-containing protein n=1 Tax=Actinoplanes subglobosus TaxID=1547892 RepID=A0ABV8IWI6_9ACTN